MKRPRLELVLGDRPARPPAAAGAPPEAALVEIVRLLARQAVDELEGSGQGRRPAE